MDALHTLEHADGVPSRVTRKDMFQHPTLGLPLECNCYYMSCIYLL